MKLIWKDFLKNLSKKKNQLKSQTKVTGISWTYRESICSGIQSQKSTDSSNGIFLLLLPEFFHISKMPAVYLLF